MSNHQESPVIINIPEVVTEDGVTLYMIVVEIGTVQYKVKQRYSKFESLHNKLVEEGVEKDLLPPKKLLGNKEPAFIMKRRKDLETYLRTIFHFFEKNLPSVLAEFLEFQVYDIHYIVRDLASNFHDTDLRPQDAGAESQLLTLSPLQLFSINERMKTPCPPMDTEDKKFDFTNVVDACCNCTNLRIQGSDELIGTSQLVPNQLKIDFLAFKSLTQLHLQHLNITPEQITSLGLLRNTLEILRANHCNISSVSQMLLCDVSDKNTDEDLNNIIASPGYSWSHLLHLDLRFAWKILVCSSDQLFNIFSNNNLTSIDRSIRLAATLTEVNLSSNNIEEISHLTGLPHLRNIDLSHNNIRDVESLHTKIGQILTLNISGNQIKNLHGLSKLYSVTNLDVSSNKLRTLADVSTVTSLPCIESLTLSPNKVNNEVDYR